MAEVAGVCVTTHPRIPDRRQIWRESAQRHLLGILTLDLGWFAFWPENGVLLTAPELRAIADELERLEGTDADKS